MCKQSTQRVTQGVAIGRPGSPISLWPLWEWHHSLVAHWAGRRGEGEDAVAPFGLGAAVAAGIPLLLAAMSIVLGMGLTVIIGQVLDVSMFVTNMITMIGLAVGIDLALAMSLYSAKTDLSLPPLTAVFGEISLAGEIRAVPHAERAEPRTVARDSSLDDSSVSGASWGSSSVSESSTFISAMPSATAWWMPMMFRTVSPTRSSCSVV